MANQASVCLPWFFWPELTMLTWAVNTYVANLRVCSCILPDWQTPCVRTHTPYSPHRSASTLLVYVSSDMEPVLPARIQYNCSVLLLQISLQKGFTKSSNPEITFPFHQGKLMNCQNMNWCVESNRVTEGFPASWLNCFWLLLYYYQKANIPTFPTISRLWKNWHGKIFTLSHFL